MYANQGGTAFPIEVLMSLTLPVNLKLSGKLCKRKASLIVIDRVATGWTFLHPEIIANVVATVAPGSFQICLLYVVL